MKCKEKISGKFILLDTGVIIRAYEYFDEFEVFFKSLQEVNCSPVYFPFIEFEFIRGAYEPEHREKRKTFLKKIAKVNLNLPTADIVDGAIQIANCYAARKIHTASLIDCCIAAFLRKYYDKLYLVTLNHKDFPTFLFNRFEIYPIDTQKDIFPLAFYEYDLKKAINLNLSEHPLRATLK